MKTKPFNLQLALEGHPVVCRDTGDEVKHLELKGNTVHGVQTRVKKVYDLYGVGAGASLRMAVRTEKRWIGVFKRNGRLNNTEYSYTTVDKLKSSVISQNNFADWQFIEIEVEL